MVLGIFFHYYRGFDVIFHSNRHTFPITTMVYKFDICITLPYANFIGDGD